MAEHGDVDGIIHLERVVFDNNLLDREWYRGKSSAPGYSQDLHLHAVAPGGKLVAFANGWADLDARVGELESVRTLSTARKRLVAATVLACFRRMQRLGVRRAYVATEAEPYAANRLYELLGPSVKCYEDHWVKKLR
ncbi:MAG: hypothetical protein Q8P31_02410 [Bacillota bacterium]|nr:hypothetical protein [Bacillota bacterium]